MVFLDNAPLLRVKNTIDDPVFAPNPRGFEPPAPWLQTKCSAKPVVLKPTLGRPPGYMGGRGLIGGFVVTQVDDSLLADVIHDNRYLLSLHEYLLRYIKEGELIVGE